MTKKKLIITAITISRISLERAVDLMPLRFRNVTIVIKATTQITNGTRGYQPLQVSVLRKQC